jgi:hypothetical protein
MAQQRMEMAGKIMEGKIIKTPDDFAPNDFANSSLAAPLCELPLPSLTSRVTLLRENRGGGVIVLGSNLDPDIPEGVWHSVREHQGRVWNKRFNPGPAQLAGHHVCRGQRTTPGQRHPRLLPLFRRKCHEIKRKSRPIRCRSRAGRGSRRRGAQRGMVNRALSRVVRISGPAVGACFHILMELPGASIKPPGSIRVWLLLSF